MIKVHVFKDLAATYREAQAATFSKAYAKGKTKAKQVWRWNVRARNGKIMCTSGEPFYSKANAMRAAIRFIGMLRVDCKLVEEAAS